MKLVFGCGYLGKRVARLWRDGGQAVCVVTRSPAKAEKLRADGFRAIVADVCRRETLGEMPRAETILFAVGYERIGGEARSIHDVYAGGVRNALDAVQDSGGTDQDSKNVDAEHRAPEAEPLFIYISSTGVYGDAAGDWVDEASPCRPLREGGRASLAAEEVIAAHPRGRRAIVLRLAGIYGPGRIPRADALRRGEPIDAPADGYLNLIHVDDAAQIVLDAEQAANDGQIVLPQTYCVADDGPGLRREYYAELARLLGAPPPLFAAPAADSPAAQRAAADKRISNAKLKREVGVRLIYPSFREGLAAIVGGS